MVILILDENKRTACKLFQKKRKEKTRCWERLKAGEEGDDRGWVGWMASPTRWTWVWAIPGDGEGQGSLACCSPLGHKESDMTQQLNNNKQQFWRKDCSGEAPREDVLWALHRAGSGAQCAGGSGPLSPPAGGGDGAGAGVIPVAQMPVADGDGSMTVTGAGNRPKCAWRRGGCLTEGSGRRAAAQSSVGRVRPSDRKPSFLPKINVWF